MKSGPNDFFDRKGSGTKPPSQERVPSQANGAVLWGRRKGGGVKSSRGVTRNPGVQMGSRSCRGLYGVCSPLNTTCCLSAGAEERRILVVGGRRDGVQGGEHKLV